MLQEDWKKRVFGISGISLIVYLGELQLLLPSRVGTHNTNICKDFIIVVQNFIQEVNICCLIFLP